MLRQLHDVDVNFDVDSCEEFTSENGWQIDDRCVVLPPERLGSPVPGGCWETACRLVANYEFADPSIVRAIYHPSDLLKRPHDAAGMPLLLDALPARGASRRSDRRSAGGGGPADPHMGMGLPHTAGPSRGRSDGLRNTQVASTPAKSSSTSTPSKGCHHSEPNRTPRISPLRAPHAKQVRSPRAQQEWMVWYAQRS